MSGMFFETHCIMWCTMLNNIQTGKLSKSKVKWTSVNVFKNHSGRPQGRLHHGCPLALVIYTGCTGAEECPLLQVILHQKSKSRGQFEYKEQHIVVILYIGQHWTLSTDPTQSQAVWRRGNEACRHYVLVSAQVCGNQRSAKDTSDSLMIDEQLNCTWLRVCMCICACDSAVTTVL